MAIATIMDTTHFNHTNLGTAAKPLIPNLIFKEMMESLRAGETDLYELIIEEFSLEASQKRTAECEYRNIKK